MTYPSPSLPRSHTHQRVTVSVTPEVLEAFQWLASASGASVGRAMGDWLESQRDAVEFTAAKVQQAKDAPGLVAREMHAYAQGLADETGALMKRVGQMRRSEEGAPLAGKVPRGAAPPRPVIRGGKSPGKGKRTP